MQKLNNDANEQFRVRQRTQLHWPILALIGFMISITSGCRSGAEAFDLHDSTPSARYARTDWNLSRGGLVASAAISFAQSWRIAF
jgi:hypothetical protein